MSHTRQTIAFALAAATLLALGGCASGTGGKDYSRDQTRAVQEVQMGMVESVREVNIEGTKSAVGAGAGAVVGGVAGNTVGSGTGRALATAVGAVLGGLGGAAVEEGVTRQNGIEITVKLDTGKLIAITQTADESFRVGDRVRVLSGGGTTRVSH